MLVTKYHIVISSSETKTASEGGAWLESTLKHAEFQFGEPLHYWIGGWREECECEGNDHDDDNCSVLIDHINTVRVWQGLAPIEFPQ